MFPLWRPPPTPEAELQQRQLRAILDEALRDRPLLRLAAGLRALDRGLTARLGGVAAAAA
jgi:hypothetical protein